MPRAAVLCCVLLLAALGAVTRPSLTARAAGPTVTGIAPNSGSVAGGTTITITGTGFSTTPGATTVQTGTTAATAVVCNSSTHCTARTLARTAGIAHVTVTVGGLTSATSTADQFTYTASTPPTSFTEYSQGITPTSQPFGITAGPDGNLWFTELFGNSIGRITPAGTITEFSSGISGGVEDMTAGPDGNLWFADGGGGIGRITPAGTVNEFSSGIKTHSSPLGIAAGPDGNLWFTEFGCAICGPMVPAAIGRITPTGTVTEFSTGITAGSSLQGIAAGPDGNLWFTEYDGNRIGRITPTGAVNEFSTGITANSFPIDITAGPDGNLWFTEFSGNRIGRITPTGTVTEFSTGISTGSSPRNITAGPDGNLWFTEINGDRIARITTAGTVTEFNAGITANSAPTGITTGPDGNLWFAEARDRIGRTAPPPTVTAVSPNSGSAAGGTTITVSGTGFSTVAGATTLQAGGVAATAVVCSSVTTCTARTLPHLAGTVDVTVNVNGVVSATSPTDHFTYTTSSPPTTFTEYSSGIAAGSAPQGITVGPDGNLWFTEPTGNRIGRITPAGVITEFSSGLTPNSKPFGITAGPDGNLWFTELTGKHIGRITTSGVITEFGNGISSSLLFGITSGPDGNLWFTEFASIGRITPAGTVTEFSSGISAGSEPDGITTGPDGNLWFAEFGVNRIGRITPAGVATEFSAGISTNSAPVGIAAGPDGNLWFTEQGCGGCTPAAPSATARITPGGTVTEFSSGITADSAPRYIAAGPDGNLWFTEQGCPAFECTSAVPAAVGRITPAGAVTEFSSGMTADSAPQGITAGPDGNLWFTENAGNRIGRTAPPPAVTSVSPSSGSAAGGTTITLTGTNFSTVPGQTLVLAGGTAATAIVCSSKTTCTAQTLPHTAGTVDVTATVNGVTGTPNVGDPFTYTTGTFPTTFAEYSTGITPNSTSTDITVGPDGNLWFTEPGCSFCTPAVPGAIGRITPADVVTEFTTGISAGSFPLDITAGPDGNLWFTELKGNRIGRITPAGVVTEFSTGISPNSFPHGITAGPDGNLWFTEQFDGIGRITPTAPNTVTEFRTGITAGSTPIGITAGPDGNLWFTEQGCLGCTPAVPGAIGRITPAGPNTVTEFRSGITANSGPFGITAGPDGNLWFTEQGCSFCAPAVPGAVGRITPAGPNTVTEFRTGISAGSELYGLTAGPDGNLWFTEFQGSRIGRITPAGPNTVTEFSAGISAGSLPDRITAGPDGNLWFTENGGNRIGRSAPPGPPAVAAVFPNAGLATGGATVTIAGASFDPTPANDTVRFGNAIATVQSCAPNAMQCTVTSPAGSLGATVDVTVTVGGVTSALSPADHFTYVSLDVNADATVTVTDAICVLRHVALLDVNDTPTSMPCPKPLPNGDVNGDGIFANVTDAICVLRFIAQLPATTACPVSP